MDRKKKARDLRPDPSRAPRQGAPSTAGSGWAAALAWQERRLTLPPGGSARRVASQEAVQAVLERAREVLRRLRHPLQLTADRWPAPGELDLERTLTDDGPAWEARRRGLAWPGGRAAPAVRRRTRREVDLVVVLDLSLSMTSQRLAFTALAVAVLRLGLAGRQSLVAFDTTARVLTSLEVATPAAEGLRRLLEDPADGYTDLAAGLRGAASALARARPGRRAVVLVTDGLANHGPSPVPLAASLRPLHVVQTGRPLPEPGRLCRELARVGGGRYLPAPAPMALPAVARQLVLALGRGG